MVIGGCLNTASWWRDQQKRFPHNPHIKVHGADMGPTWGRQDPGGPHVGPINLALLEFVLYERNSSVTRGFLPQRAIDTLGKILPANQFHIKSKFITGGLGTKGRQLWCFNLFYYSKICYYRHWQFQGIDSLDNVNNYHFCWIARNKW